MDFLDYDDDFLRDLPCLADWCPGQRRMLPCATTLVQSTLLDGSIFPCGFDELGACGLSAPAAVERCLFAPGAKGVSQLVPGQLSTASSNVELAGVASSVPSQTPDLPCAPETWVPLLEPLHLSGPFATSTASTPEIMPSMAGGPWPWYPPVPHPSAVLGSPQAQPLQPQRPADAHPLASASALGVLQPRSVWPRIGARPSEAPTVQVHPPLQQYQHQLLQHQLQQQHQQQQQHCPRPQEQQHVQQQTRKLLGSIFGGTPRPSDRCMDAPEIPLMAEIQAAHWPSSPEFVATAAAYHRAATAARATARLASVPAPLPPPSPPPPPAASGGGACAPAPDPATCGVAVPQSVFDCCTAANAAAIAASAPATPLLSPPSPPELYLMGGHVQVLRAVRKPLAAPGLPPRTGSAPAVEVPRFLSASSHCSAVCSVQPAASPEARSAAASQPQPQPQPQSMPRLGSHGVALAATMPAVTAAGAAAFAAASVSSGPCSRPPPHGLDMVPAAVVAAAPTLSLDGGRVNVKSHRDGFDDDDEDAFDAFDDDDDDDGGDEVGEDSFGRKRAGAAKARRGGGGYGGFLGQARCARGVKCDIPIEVLRTAMDLPVRDAVKALGTNQSHLKRLCRALGIKRWPFRKLNCLTALALAVEADRELLEEERQELLQRLARNRALILEHPNAELEPFVLPARQAHYKKGFLERRGAKQSHRI